MTITDDYLLSRAELAGPDAAILDLGCGDGRFVERLLQNGLNTRGIDLPDARKTVEARNNPALNERIIYLENPEIIPLPDKSIDLVVSNTVFEHIPTLESTVSELARVLRPNGCVYTIFPLHSCIMEQHINLPLFHRIKSRSVRLKYAKTANALGLYRSSADPEYMEHFVAKYCFYRSRNEVESIFGKYFASVKSDARAYAETKLRGLGVFGPFIHHFHSAAYHLSSPR